VFQVVNRQYSIEEASVSSQVSPGFVVHKETFWDFFVFSRFKIPLLVTHFTHSVYHKHCVIDLRDLDRCFLKHISLSIEQGEVHAGTGQEFPEGKWRCGSTVALISTLYGARCLTPRSSRFTSKKEN
jgi:hypothetical protein